MLVSFLAELTYNLILRNITASGVNELSEGGRGGGNRLPKWTYRNARNIKNNKTETHFGVKCNIFLCIPTASENKTDGSSTTTRLKNIIKTGRSCAIFPPILYVRTSIHRLKQA